MELIAGFLAGAGSSGHCLGMCGPLALALQAGARGRGARVAWIQALYHAGRVSTYVFLGVLAGAAGMRLQPVQRPLGIAAGVFLVLLGGLGLFPARATGAQRWLAGSPLCAVLGRLTTERTPLAALSLGVFNGFVPCGLVVAMLAAATTAGSALHGGLLMAGFGAGTVPALSLAGVAAHVLAPVPRGRSAAPFTGRFLAPVAVRLSGIVTVGLGLLILYRSAVVQGPCHIL